MRSALIAVAFVAAVAVSPVHAAGVLVDGSFETPDGADPSTFFGNNLHYQPVGVGAPATFSTLGSAHPNNITFSNALVIDYPSVFGFQAPPEGTQTLGLVGNTSVVTTKAYGMILGAVYRLLFDAAGSTGNNLVSHAFSVTAGGISPSNGASTFSFSPPSDGVYQTYSTGAFKFKGNNSVTFTSLGSTPFQVTSVDKLRFQLIAAPTPEPEAYLSILLGIGLTAGIARRRARRAAATAAA